MASVDVIVVLAILLVLQPTATMGNFLSPLLAPAFEDVCEKMNCGKGKCKSSQNSTFFYECECEPGWTQTILDDQNDTLKFLPCIVPNCSLNHACTEAPSPVQQKATKDNESIFDLCHWIDCGRGSCKKTSMFTYSCECAVDYYNLLNVSTFPCFKKCAIGIDCKDFGLLTPFSQPPAPVLSDNSENQGEISSIVSHRGLLPSDFHYETASNLLGNVHWLILLMMSLALVF